MSPLSEQKKAEMFSDHPLLVDENGDDVVVITEGIDDILTDERGRIWIGDEDVGGKDIVDDIDPHLASSNYGTSPAELQRLGLARKRNEEGRFVAEPEPEQPLWTVPCLCGECVDMRKVNPTGAAWDTETGQAYVQHTCKCGQERITYADEVPDAIQRKALFEAEVMNEILENHMERPPKW